MRVNYVRFIQSVAEPGYGGNDLSKARLARFATSNTSRTEKMDDMFIVGDVLVLQKECKTRDGVAYVAQRVTPLENCRDLEMLELVEPPPWPKKKKSKGDEPDDNKEGTPP